MKKIAVVLLFLLLIPQGIFAESLPADTVHAYMDGYSLNEKGNVETFVKDSRTYIPVSLLEKVKTFTISADKSGKKIKLTSGDHTVTMEVDKKEYKKGDDTVAMDVAPFKNGDTVYLPLRYVAEAFGKEVYWGKDARVVVIGSYLNGAPSNDEIRVATKAGYSFEIPEADKNRYVIEDDGGEVRIYDKNNYRKADHIGRIGTISKVTDPSCADCSMILLTQLPGGYLVFTYAENSGISDDAASELKADYEQSKEQIKDILKTVKTLERVSLK